MIKKLRKKFVFTTMAFMTVTFGVLLLVYHFTTKFWDEQEILNNLKWYSKSDSFFEFDESDDEMLNEYDSPIFAIWLDEGLNILNVQSSYKTTQEAPSKSDISAIFHLPSEKYTWKSYIYCISETPEGYLLIITDTSEGLSGIYRNIGVFLLIAAGFLGLLLISIFLSRFVTLPAKEALEREKQFISDASHELKTPLAAISINAQAMQTEFQDNRNLKNILSATKRMDALIQKLLKLSYLEETRSKVEMKEFSLSQCCEEIALSMESSIYEKRITFRYEIEDAVSYFGNENDIKQVIAILLDNALKYTPKLGVISFRLERKESGKVIRIENSGEGIQPEELPHIFERFYRVDKSRSVNDNSYGLGLAIAKAIVEAHGASIHVSGEYGKNIFFEICL